MARADSIHKLTVTAARQIRAALKAHGITVAEVDGGHESDHALRGLQELQAIQQGLNDADAADAAKASEPRTGWGNTGAISTDADTTDTSSTTSHEGVGRVISTGTGSTGKK